MTAINVDVQYASKQSNLPDKDMLARWVNTTLQYQMLPHILFQKEGAIELTIRIVDEVEAKHLNETWRQHHGPTNVLSFPFECPPHTNIPLLGDIVICAPLVMHEAAEQDKLLVAHWAHLVVHGTLHLLGYDHTEKTQAQIMEDIEIRILHNLGYSNPYYIIEPL